MYGKELRLARLMNFQTKRCFMVPIDHGLTYGFIDGLENYSSLINSIVDGGADAIILHKGLLKTVSKYSVLGSGKYIMHLSASTIQSSDSTHKVLISSVEEAIKLGADGVSIQVNLGTLKETEMIKDLGKVSKECLEWGMPLIAMMYSQRGSDGIMHAARVAEELGADIIKISYPGSMEEMEKITSCVQIPVLVAGGTKVEMLEDLFIMINSVVAAGAAGVAIGRNVFQCRDPKLISSLISKLVHKRIQVEECIYQGKELMNKEASINQFKNR